jgi:hypothetical protein
LMSMNRSRKMAILRMIWEKKTITKMLDKKWQRNCLLYYY